MSNRIKSSSPPLQPKPVRPSTSPAATKDKKAVVAAQVSTRNLDTFQAAPSATPSPSQPDRSLVQMYGRADFDQGQTNSCGTTSLAICLERMGVRVPRTEIDSQIREVNIWTSMDDITQYAKGKGLQAAVYDKGSFEKLQNELANGRQIMVLTDVEQAQDGKLSRGSEKDTGWHYMVATEAFTSEGKQYVTYQNPWGVQQTVPFERFDQLWSNLKMFNAEVGFDRSYILLDQADSKKLPASNAFELAAPASIMHGVSNLANGVADLGKGRIAQGASRVAAGVVGSVTGLAANALSVSGLAIENAGGTGAGKALETAGNAVGWIGNSVAKGIKKIGE
ncbi:MAG: C39 family peptidase [Deltaproteobacteria bacterium]|nr:C39 family peptidase [Deltaproteobacteria bacterium]